MQKCYNSTTKAEVGLQVKFGQKNPWPECNIFVGSTVTHGSEINLSGNVLWLPNGSQKNPWPCTVWYIVGVKGYVKVNQMSICLGMSYMTTKFGEKLWSECNTFVGPWSRKGQSEVSSIAASETLSVLFLIVLLHLKFWGVPFFSRGYML